MTEAEIEAVARIISPGRWWQSGNVAIGDTMIDLFTKERSLARYRARRAIEALDYLRRDIDPDAETMTEAQRLSYENGLWEANTIASNHALIASDGGHPDFEAGWREAALEIQTEIEELITASRKTRGLD